MSKPRLAPVVPSDDGRLHWVRRGDAFAVWHWTQSSGVWHATPATLFFTPKQAAEEGWAYVAPALPPPQEG